MLNDSPHDTHFDLILSGTHRGGRHVHCGGSGASGSGVDITFGEDSAASTKFVRNVFGMLMLSIAVLVTSPNAYFSPPLQLRLRNIMDSKTQSENAR